MAARNRGQRWSVDCHAETDTVVGTRIARTLWMRPMVGARGPVPKGTETEALASFDRLCDTCSPGCYFLIEGRTSKWIHAPPDSKSSAAGQEAASPGSPAKGRPGLEGSPVPQAAEDTSKLPIGDPRRTCPGCGEVNPTGVHILDDNPVSIAYYLEKHPEFDRSED